MSEQIKLSVGPGARTSTIETSGFKGNACKEATEGIKKLLGEVVVSEDTAEAFESAACELHQHQ